LTSSPPNLLRVIEALIVETGAMVRAGYADRNTLFSNLDIVGYVKEKEDADPMYFTSLLNHISKAITEAKKPTFILIIGMRSLKNINDLKKIAPKWRHIIIWIDVKSRNLLRDRYNKKEHKNLSRDEFISYLLLINHLALRNLKPSQTT